MNTSLSKLTCIFIILASHQQAHNFLKKNIQLETLEMEFLGCDAQLGKRGTCMSKHVWEK